MDKRVRVRILEDTHYVIRRLSSKKIDIYNIEYSTYGNIYTINEKDMANLPLEVEIISYNGIKGIIFGLKVHKHFIISLFISIILMFIISNTIVEIEVIHNDKYIRELVMDELRSNDIHPLMFKKSFSNIQNIKKKIIKNHPENIEWLEIIDDGMKYTVRVEERIITKEKEIKEYCDIISMKDAIVLSSSVSSGQIVVDPNDRVKKGSTLVSGAIKFNEETKAYTCAEALIYGNTWYTVNVNIPYSYISKKYTGSKKHNIAFEFGSKRTSLLKVHFKEYETKRKKIFAIGDFTIYSETHKEFVSKKEKYKDSEIKELALKKGREQVLMSLDDDSSILDEKVLQTNYFDSIIEMDIFYSIKEKIGKQVEKEIPTNEEVQKNEITE